MGYKLIFSTISLLAVLHLSSGAYNLTKCYECEYFDKDKSDDGNSTQSKKCEENPPPENFIVECGKSGGDHGDTTEWQCIKVVGRIEVEEENYNYIKRSCSPGRNYDTCKDCKDTKSYETRHGFVKRGKHCVCDDDDSCNTANSNVIGAVTLVTGLFVVYITKAF